MKAIWRQVIEITDEQTISAPGLSRVIAVEGSRGKPEVWFEMDSDKAETEVTLWTVGTGHVIPTYVTQLGSYIGHYLAEQGRFVGHLYASVPLTPKVKS